MSDGPLQTGGTPRILAQAQARGEQVVRLISLPDALQNNSRGQRIDGEVVRQNPDGSTRIRTAQGDVDVEVRGRQPQPGQRVEVDVPAGRPPRQAVIRQAPQQQQGQNIEQQPAQSQIARTQNRADIAVQNARSDQARELIETAQRPQARQVQNLPPRQTTQPLPPQAAPQSQNTATPLPPGTPVRLTPVSPAQVQQFITQLVQNFPPVVSTIQTAAFQAAQIAQNVTAQNLQTLVTTPALPAQSTIPQTQNPLQTILSSLFKPSAPLPTPQAQPIATSPLLQTLAQTAPQTTLQILPASTAVPQASNITFLPQNNALNLNPALPQPANLSQNALPITTPLTATQPALQTQSALPFINPVDVKVQNIIQNIQNILVSPPNAKEIGAAKQNTRSLPLPAQITLPKAITTPTGQAGQIIGQVTAFTPQNLPVVSLQLPGQALPQSFILQYQPAGTTIGSQIIFQPNTLTAGNPAQAIPQPGQIIPTSTLGQIPQALLSFGDQYPPLLMQETYQALLNAAPALAGSLSRALPSPANPTQLGAAALLFLTAVRASDLSSWLGDKKIEALSRDSRSNLLSRLMGRDGASAPRASLDLNLPSGEWRAVPLPMFWDGDIRQVNLFVRRDGENTNDSEENEKQQTRFIFDLSMSRMGEVQIDGLMRADRLDMVVRTQNPLSAPMQQMLKQVYTKALDSESLRGELGFQGDPRQWVNILKAEQAYGAEV